MKNIDLISHGVDDCSQMKLDDGFLLKNEGEFFLYSEVEKRGESNIKARSLETMRALERLTAENIVLKKTIDELSKENTELKMEKSRLLDDLAKKDLCVNIMQFVFHELNNLGLPVVSYTELLKFDLDNYARAANQEKEVLWEKVLESVEASDKAARIFFEVLTKGRRYFSSKEIFEKVSWQDCFDDLRLIFRMERRGDDFMMREGKVRLKVRCNGLENKLMLIDQFSLRLLVGNYIKNSLEALGVQAEKEISICLENIGDWIKLTVEDNGCGFSRQEGEAIGRGGYTSKSGSGSGKGLESCRYLLNKCGGSLKIESEGRRLGTMVTMLIPCKREQEEE